MSRLAHGLFAAVSVLSVLFFLAAGFLWIRTGLPPLSPGYEYFKIYAMQQYNTSSDPDSLLVTALRGDLGVFYFHTQGYSQKPEKPVFYYWIHNYVRRDDVGTPIRFYVERSTFTRGGRTVKQFGAQAPAWFVMMIAAFAPSLWVTWKVRERRRLRRCRLLNLCSVCGYDLRASDDRCPECGTSIAMAK